MRYLTAEEVLRLHFHLIEDYGGRHGVRDENRLLASIAAPNREVYGQKQFPAIWDKAAVYMRNLIGDHLFLDGNKRTAVTVCAIFLHMNGRDLSCSPKELEDFAVRVATEHLEIAAIAAWLEAHSQ